MRVRHRQQIKRTGKDGYPCVHSSRLESNPQRAADFRTRTIFFRFISVGFPASIGSELVGEGIGAVRYATFEKGVLFVETINEWDEPHRLSFSIHADTKNIPPTTFDEHVIIGGKYFDVLSGTYWIEDIGNGDVTLHLSSEQRLSTRFNFYSHFWTEYLMANLQNYILEIIKKRCESN
jgi:hypothetical protein